VLQHVQAVALRLDQVGVRVGAGPGVAAEAPGREHQLAEGAAAERLGRQQHRPLAVEHLLEVGVAASLTVPSPTPPIAAIRLE
jgi:hypothetical protein